MRLATSAATALRSVIADIAIISVARSILRGRPPMRPRARAAASLAMEKCALGDQLAFKLGKSSEDAERDAPIRGRRVYLCTRSGQHLQPRPLGCGGVPYRKQTCPGRRLLAVGIGRGMAKIMRARGPGFASRAKDHLAARRTSWKQRQERQGRTRLFDSPTHGSFLVRGQIVHDHDIAGFQSRY